MKKKKQKLSRKTRAKLQGMISYVPKEVKDLLNECFEDYSEKDAHDFIERIKRDADYEG